LLQLHAELSDKIGNVEEALERLDDPTGENKDSVVLCGPEISGAWLWGKYGLTRLTPRPQ
jgi:hypothetical protein